VGVSLLSLTHSPSPPTPPSPTPGLRAVGAEAPPTPTPHQPLRTNGLFPRGPHTQQQFTPRPLPQGGGEGGGGDSAPLGACAERVLPGGVGSSVQPPPSSSANHLRRVALHLPPPTLHILGGGVGSRGIGAPHSYPGGGGDGAGRRRPRPAPWEGGGDAAGAGGGGGGRGTAGGGVGRAFTLRAAGGGLVGGGGAQTSPIFSFSHTLSKSLPPPASRPQHQLPLPIPLSHT